MAGLEEFDGDVGNDCVMTLISCGGARVPSVRSGLGD